MVSTRKAASTYPTEGQPTEKLLLPKSGNLPPAKLGCEYPTCLGPNRIWNLLLVFKGWLLLFTFLLTFCFPFHLSFVPWIPVFVDVFLRAISLPFLACFLDYQHWCLILQDFFLFCKDLCPLYGFDPILIGFLHWSLVYVTYIYYEPPSISASHDLLHPFILPWLIWLSIINFLVYICTTQSLPHLAAGFCFHFFSCHCSGVAVLETHYDNLKLEGGWGRAHRLPHRSFVFCFFGFCFLMIIMVIV